MASTKAEAQPNIADAEGGSSLFAADPESLTRLEEVAGTVSAAEGERLCLRRRLGLAAGGLAPFGGLPPEMLDRVFPITSKSIRNNKG